MTHRVRPPLVALIVLLAACGESEQEKANRAQLASLVQRYQGLAQDYAEWAEHENDSASPVTWTDAFEEYDRAIEERHHLRSDLRGVVTMPKYACVGQLLGRAIQNDVAFLRARKSLLQNRMVATNAGKLYEQNMAGARSSYYGFQGYMNAAGEALSSQGEAITRAERFMKAANERQARVLSLSDSLAFAARQLELLPLIDTVRTLPLLTDIESDSVVTSEGIAAITAVCAPPAPPRRDKGPPQRRAPAADSTAARTV